jgi:hypothetical protein
MGKKNRRKSDVPEYWLPFDLARASAKLKRDGTTGYQHKGGRGEHREEVVRKFLRGRLPQTTAIAKGHIVDSHDNITSEFDIILFDPLTRLVIAQTAKSNKVLPVESVQAVIEVRTRLNEKAVREAAGKVAELEHLKRYYRPIMLGEALLMNVEESKQAIPATVNSPYANRIPCFLIGYTGVSDAVLWKSLSSYPDVFEAVLKIGEYVFLNNHGHSVVLKAGDYSLVKVVLELLNYLQGFTSRSVATAPDFDRYLDMERLRGYELPAE